MAVSTRKSKTSKGIHSNVAKSTLKAVKRDRCPIEKNLMLIKAWRKGLNPWITIPNPNKSETNKLFIRVRANQEWGNYKRTAPSNQPKED
jgi:hypothetical protein